MAEEFVPPSTAADTKDCGGATTGTKRTDLKFISYSTTGDTDYPEDACGRLVHGNAQIDNFTVNQNLTVSGTINGTTTGNKTTAAFDIPHPTKEGWRLRHTCPEGPSNDVYFRGRISNKDKIYLPKYWEELVDPTTITVNLTPIGAHQNVIVKRIGENVIHLQANGGLPINCFFHVFATRADGERLIPEYEGESPADYPGNNEEYSISGYHYDTKETK